MPTQTVFLSGTTWTTAIPTELTLTKVQVAETPVALHWAGKTIFELKKDGKIIADWAVLMRLKDKLLNNDCADAAELAVCTWAAALWLARNT